MTTPLARSLQQMGVLYIVAGLLQTGWLGLVLMNPEAASSLLNVQLIGWAFGALWIMMAWCGLHLPYVGVQLIRLGRDHNARIVQSVSQMRRMKIIRRMLVIGMLLDVICVPLLSVHGDKTLVVFATGMIGWRIVWVNLEAITQYYNR